MGGGYANPRTFSSVSDQTNYQLNAQGDMCLYTYQATGSNITVTRTSTSIRIQGTVTALASTAFIGVFHNSNLKDVYGKPITSIFRLTDNLGNLTSGYGQHISIQRHTTLYYQNQTSMTGKEDNIFVVNFDDAISEAYIIYGVHLGISQDSSINIDISISDIRIYRGAFINPPNNVSFINEAISRLENTTTYLNSKFKRIYTFSLSGQKWSRLVKIPFVSTEVPCFMRFFISKGFNTHPPFLIEISACYHFNTSSVLRTNLQSIDAINYSNDINRSTLVKFRYAKDSSNNFYIEGWNYMTLSNSETYYIVLEFFFRPNGAPNQYSNLNFDLVPSSNDGTNDVLQGVEFGYHKAGSGTYVDPT